MSMSAEVSAGNPCPFLRAAVAGGYLDGHVDQLAAVSQLVVDAGAVPAGEARRVRRATYFIGLIGNGLNPIRLVRNWRRGLTADELRGGPLDKRGAGSRILDASGLVDRARAGPDATNSPSIARLRPAVLERVLGARAIDRDDGRELRPSGWVAPALRSQADGWRMARPAQGSRR